MNELEIIGRVCAALLLGGLIGVEREAKGHAAGLRTYMLVALGAALFMIGSEQIALRYAHLSPAPDPTRIASTIVQGIGFLGAGVIFQAQHRIRNVTTAAGIWVTAAIGLLAGGGFYVSAVSGTLITVVVLALLPRVEGWINRSMRRGPAADYQANQRDPDDDDP